MGKIMKKVFLICTMCLMALTMRAANDGPKVEYVDLGVSVKWATCNLGASKPEDYGDYYAWGETEPYYDGQATLTWKDDKPEGYRWSSYAWCNDGDYTCLTKYNTDSKFGIVDNKTVLEEADDVARVKGGGRLPTDAEWTELRTQCTWTKITRGGVTGYSVTSKVNGNSIFLPAAGYRSGRSLNGDDVGGHYWSSSVDTEFPYTAWRVYFNSGGVYRCNLSRVVGLPVRPVSESGPNSPSDSLVIPSEAKESVSALPTLLFFVDLQRLHVNNT